jgi:hypothetical protein
VRRRHPIPHRKLNRLLQVTTAITIYIYMRFHLLNRTSYRLSLTIDYIGRVQ